MARYCVVPDGGFHWLERHSITGTVNRISPYTDPGVAEGVADHLNSFVRWEAPT